MFSVSVKDKTFKLYNINTGFFSHDLYSKCTAATDIAVIILQCRIDNGLNSFLSQVLS